MIKNLSITILFVLITASTFALAGTASAEEAKMVGNLSKIEMAADQKSATVTVKDTKSGENVVIFVSDDLTLDKFKDKRIVEGDEVRCKYEKEGGRNMSKLFKKTAGC